MQIADHTARMTTLGASTVLALALILAAPTGCVTAAEERLLNSFEDEAELGQWQISSAGSRLVEEGVTHGDKALELTFDPQGRWFPVTMFWNRVLSDWSPYDALVVDVYNPNEFPIPG
ncbi:MAG: hypothetical protein ACE5R4_04910, partial [Armatimonadota bacterium]